jgi:HAMP domain-containing protein
VLLQSTLGDTGARAAWCVLLGLCTVWLLRSVAAAARAIGGLAPWQWLVFGVLFQRCVAQNLTHGQLSLPVATFVAAGTAALVHGRDARAGAWLGVAAALKITPVLFLPALVAMARPRAALSMLLAAGLAVFVLPWPFCGTAEHGRHLADLWRTATESVAAPEQSAIVRSGAGPSIKGALDYLLQPRPTDAAGHTVNLFAVSDATLRTITLVWSALLAALFAAWFWRARALPTGARLVHQASAVMLAMSVFAPLLRVYHLAAALVPFALFCRGPRGRGDVLWWATSLLLLATMTLRQRKLLGEAAWRFCDGGALLHLALVLLAVWLVREARAGAPSAQQRGIQPHP